MKWSQLAIEELWLKEKPTSNTFPRKFRQWFGCDECHCDTLWHMLRETGWLWSVSSVSEKHLLWALCFLRRYDYEYMNGHFFQTCEKNFREKVWFIIEGISRLHQYLVCTIYICNHHCFAINCILTNLYFLISKRLIGKTVYRMQLPFLR